MGKDVNIQAPVAQAVVRAPGEMVADRFIQCLLCHQMINVEAIKAHEKGCKGKA